MFRKRKYRRLTRKARPRSRMYMRRRMRRLRLKTRPEMKITALQASAQANKLAIDTVPTSTLFSDQNFSSDILSNIAQGTNYFQRIGNTIFVKGIRFRILTYGCSSSEQISISNFLLRIIIWTGENTAGNNVPLFFNAATNVNFHAPVNRKFVRQVLYDKVHYFNSGGYINDASSKNATSGAVKMMNIWLPLNRRVTYTVNAGVKDDENKINIAFLVASPGMSSATYNLRQICCTHYIYQMFFTDN